MSYKVVTHRCADRGWAQCTFICWLAVFVGGCQLGRSKEVPPLVSPLPNVTFRFFAGSPLSGELTQSIDLVAAKQVWAVDVRVVGVQKLPTRGFESLGPYARLVLSDGNGDLVAPSARLVYSTLFRTVDPEASLDPLIGQPSTWVEMFQSPGAVAPGSTLLLDLAQPSNTVEHSSRRSVTIELSRAVGDAGYQLALISHDLVAPPATRARPTTEPAVAPSVPLPAPKDVRETVIAARPAPAGKERLLLALPMDFADSPVAGLVIDITIDPKPAAADDLAAKLKADLDASSAKLADKLKQPPATADDRMMSALLDSLTTAGDAPRAALVYVCQQSGAALTEAVALQADDKVLALMTKSIREKIAVLPARDRATVAWMLDRTTIQTLASIKDDTTARSLAGVQGALITFAGEAGRQLDLLQSLANESRSSEDLNRRLIAEHLTFLEDNSPAARVRAYDWLNARQLAPAGYDPLASAHDRHDALERVAEAAANTQPTTQP